MDFTKLCYSTAMHLVFDFESLTLSYSSIEYLKILKTLQTTHVLNLRNHVQRKIIYLVSGFCFSNIFC